MALYGDSAELQRLRRLNLKRLPLPLRLTQLYPLVEQS